MDPKKQQQHQPISASSFTSSPLLQPAPQRPKRRAWRRHHEAPDPPRVGAHLQPKSMTLSLNSGPSSRLRPPQKQLEAMTMSCSSMDMGKKGASLSKCRSANGEFGGGRDGDGEAEAEEKRLVVAGDGIGGGGRRLFSGTDVEVGCVFAGLGARIVAKDMPPFMQIHAATCARKAYDGLEKFSAKVLAFTLKKEFDAVYGPAWHCIVGTSFGSFVTHSVGGFLYFSLDKLHILLFKTTVQKAE